MTQFYVITICILMLFLVVEYATLVKALKKIPIRILVNGTRGKSSSVKILYQIFRKMAKSFVRKLQVMNRNFISMRALNT